MEKYRATIHGNTIEWDDNAPVDVRNGATVTVDVTVIDKHPILPKEPNGKEAVAILKEIADRGGLTIKDPVKWQREIRKDRPLPGRE